MAKAKAVTTQKPPRGPVTPPRPGRGNYFVDVWQELRKVSWPTRTELIRMTQIVILTVIIFAMLIGLADLVLSVVVKQLYTQPGSTTINNLRR